MAGKEFFDRLDYTYNAWLPARQIVVDALNRRTPPQLLVFEEFASWKDHLFTLEKDLNIAPTERPIYVVYPDESGKWACPGGARLPESFISRKALPEPWRGIRDQQLSDLNGIPGCIFVHQSGFIGGNATRDGALRMAKDGLAHTGVPFIHSAPSRATRTATATVTTTTTATTHDIMDHTGQVQRPRASPTTRTATGTNAPSPSVLAVPLVRARRRSSCRSAEAQGSVQHCRSHQRHLHPRGPGVPAQALRPHPGEQDRAIETEVARTPLSAKTSLPTWKRSNSCRPSLRTQLLFVESGGDNLAAAYSVELATSMSTSSTSLVVTRCRGRAVRVLPERRARD